MIKVSLYTIFAMITWMGYNINGREYNKKKIWEIIYPGVLTVLGIIIYFVNTKFCLFDFSLTKLVNNSINIFGILLGFLVTILTIFNSLDNKYFKKLRKDGSISSLLRYLKTSIRSNILFLILALLYTSINEFDFFIVDYILLCVCLFTVFSTYRFIDIFLYLTTTKKNL